MTPPSSSSLSPSLTNSSKQFSFSNSLCVVVPCFNEEESLLAFSKAITDVLGDDNTNEWNVLFVDDGSTDNTLNICKQLHENDSRFSYISLSRNFGKESAILAGLTHSNAYLTALMDADLQDPPSLLKQMIPAIESEGYDCVGTYRKTREGEPIIRSLFSRYFYSTINSLSKLNIVENARDFQLMTRPVLDAILSMQEYNRFSKGLFEWVGFSKKWIGFDNIERSNGLTKWNMKSLFDYALEGIIAFSTAPLQMISITGIIISLFSLILLLVVFFRAVFLGDPVAGWPSLACIILFTAGIETLSLGILGQYFSKMYLESKNRPKFIIREMSPTRNKEDH